MFWNKRQLFPDCFYYMEIEKIVKRFSISIFIKMNKNHLYSECKMTDNMQIRSAGWMSFFVQQFNACG